MKRIAYVALIMSYQSGVAAKMDRLANTAKSEDIPVDYYWLTSGYNSDEKKFENINVKISKYSNPVLIRIWQARVLNRLCKKYDAVVIRYPLYDPFLDLLLNKKKKIITEHHTKEVVELRLTGSFRKYTEGSLGNYWLKKFGGIIGVTEEIIAYEIIRSGFKGKTIFIPNSIPVDPSNDLPGLIGEGEKINIIFVANFRPWHGLNIMMEGLKKAQVKSDTYQIHLVGEIPEEDLIKLKNFPNVICYGELPNQEINKMYGEMDFAIGGFNLGSKEMEESTSLKVREYFAYGLPTIIGSRDPAFPPDFEYIIQKDEFDVSEIIEFIKDNKGLAKETVRKKADKYINSKYFIRKTYNFASETV